MCARGNSVEKFSDIRGDGPGFMPFAGGNGGNAAAETERFAEGAFRGGWLGHGPTGFAVTGAREERFESQLDVKAFGEAAGFDLEENPMAAFFASGADSRFHHRATGPAAAELRNGTDIVDAREFAIELNSPDRDRYFAVTGNEMFLAGRRAAAQRFVVGRRRCAESRAKNLCEFARVRSAFDGQIGLSRLLKRNIAHHPGFAVESLIAVLGESCVFVDQVNNGTPAMRGMPL